MNNLVRSGMVACALLTASLHATSSLAAVVIHGARVIYPAEQQEVVVRLENKGERPALVQLWLDDGDKRATPATAQAPFTAMPPILRIEPKKQQAPRLRYTGGPLPADRESLFWLNVLEVQPTTVGTADRNLLELSFRSRLRVFYRPEGLPYPKTSAAPKLSWKLVRHEGGHALEVLNPTPYHVSLGSVELVGKGRDERYPKAPNKEVNDSLLLPSGDIKRFPLPNLRTPPSGALKVEFSAISDFGARVSHSADITS
ncbi:fimbria/pilus periplasmic chaperone [Pseudomonas gingeri]|uniref:fimbria/pilus periplasmic chaperone n=1 Tax=Pseudomonas gingeri TaxID=117681 RepID=UPI00159F74CB|nr:fimbria/pilus periplasmic chaperone [Pseudomonas gingeri]NVZ28896.1 fimbria/pilus periplasmic chaperone [Pseudomonas gingeri]